MKLATINVNGEPRLAVPEDDRVLDIGAEQMTLESVVADGERALARRRPAAVGRRRPMATIAETLFAPPIAKPEKFFCVASTTVSMRSS